MRMMTDYQISPAVDSQPSHFYLALSGNIVKLITPVERNNDDGIKIFSRLYIGCNFIVQVIIFTYGLIISVNTRETASSPLSGRTLT